VDLRGSRKAVGIVANQPAMLAGTLDINASVKGALCALLRLLNIPLVTFEDVPGFLPARSRSMAELSAWREAAVCVRGGDLPKVTVITRKAYAERIASCRQTDRTDVTTPGQAPRSR